MAKKLPALKNRGSLITYKDGAADRCLGYLFHSPEHGTYDPTFGRVDVSREEAETHNRLLSEAEIKGLDERCAVGQHGTFYHCWLSDKARHEVRTWIGRVVSDNVQVHGLTITFYRNEKTFRGRLRKDQEYFHFTRIT